jgi:hypothetical protein
MPFSLGQIYTNKFFFIGIYLAIYSAGGTFYSARELPMKMLLLFLSLAMLYSTAQTPFKIRTTTIYQGNVIDLLDPSRPRIA